MRTRMMRLGRTQNATTPSRMGNVVPGSKST